MKRTAILAVLGLVAAVLAGPAAAQMGSPRGFYLGGGVGQSELKFDCSGTCDTKGKDFKFFAGYQFHPMIAGEVTWNDFGETTFGAANIKGNALDISAVGTWPIGPFAILGRLGWYWGELKADTPSTGGQIKQSQDALVWGLGGQFMASRNLGVRAEYTSYTDMGGGTFTQKADVTTLTVSALFRF